MAGDLSDRRRYFIDRYILHTTQKAETRARMGREAEAELAKVTRILDEYEGTNSPTGPIAAKVTAAQALIAANDPEQAMRVAKDALQDALALEQEALRRKENREQLVELLDALPPNPQYAIQAELDMLNADRTDLGNLLRPVFPSAADLDRARVLLLNFPGKIQQVQQDSDARGVIIRELQAVHAALATELVLVSRRLENLEAKQAPEWLELSVDFTLVETDIPKMKAALDNFDMAEITRLNGQVPTIRTQLDQLKRDIGAVEGPLHLQDVQHLNISDAQKEAFASLGSKNVDAFSDAIDAIAALDQRYAGDCSAAELLQTIDDLRDARADRDAKVQDAADHPHDGTKQTDATTAQQLVVSTKEKLEIIDLKRPILQAVLSNTFSADKKPPFPPELLADAFAVIKRNPSVGQAMLGALASGTRYKEIVDTARLACDGVDSGFADRNGNPQLNADAAAWYARKLVQTAGQYPVPQDIIERYTTHPYMVQDIPELNGINNRDELTTKRARYVGKVLLGPDGKLNIDAARVAVYDTLLNFHQVSRQTPVLAEHMLETLDFLEHNPEAQQLLDDVEAPGIGGGRGLVAKDTGKQRGELTTEDFRQSILDAMLTPIYQGPVGSCFATAPAIRMRDEDPLGTMKHFRDLAVDGVLRPKTGDPVPAVKNVPNNQNALTRSFEYTVATAAARIDRKGKHRELENSADEIAKLLGEKVKSGKKRGAATARLKTAITDAFEFRYDPEVLVGDATDGSSSRGRYVLFNKATGQPVANIDDYRGVVKDIVHKTIKSGDTSFFTSRGDVAKLVDDPRFADAIKINGSEPWDLPSGGDSTSSTAVLDEPVEMAFVLSQTEINAVPPFDRPAKLMENFIGSFAPSTDPADPAEKIAIATRGRHLFNALPGHPSTAPLREGGPANLAANLQRELLDPAQALAAAPMSAAALAAPFEEIVTGLIRHAKSDAERLALRNILENEMPAADMTPRRFEQYVQTKVNAALAMRVQEEFNQWKAPLNPQPTPAEEQEKRDKIQASVDKEKRRRLDGAILNAVETPQFVIADTNWNGGDVVRYLVIIGDPVNGTAKLCEKWMPSGRLENFSEADDWMTDEWYKVDKRNP